MMKKCSTWASNQTVLSMDTNSTTMKLIPVKNDEQNQSKNLEKIRDSSPMSGDIDVSLSASTTLSPSSKDERSMTLPDEKLLKGILSTSKRNHKHHHHYRRHHHRHHHHHHHHHNHRHRVKTTNHKPAIVPSETSSIKKNVVNIKSSASIPDEINNHARISTVDKKSSSIISTKSNKGNIPLQSIENKLVSHRVAPTDETQVGNFPSMICTQHNPSMLNTGCVQAIEQIVYQDDCCLPASTIECASNSCCYQQSEPMICFPQQHQQQQQQQQQLYLCSDPCSTQDYICSSSRAMQPTFINQIPACNSSCTNLSSSRMICISQPTVQAPTNIIIQQQPQIQAQQAQFIQVPQAQPAQYLQITSATPQIIQTIQAPAVQNLQPQMIQAIQAPAQFVAASPQILYQRPYDPIMVPVQNQQFAVAQAPLVALSQPSYAPVRRPPVGPRMFQQALVRTVADRTGLPVFSPNMGSGLQLAQPSMMNPTRGGALASTGRALLTGGAQPSTSLPIVPLTPGGLLIPFQPSEPPKGMIQGTLPRRTGPPSNLRNYDLIRQQIQQRGQLLAELQRQNSARMPSPSRNPANTAFPSLFSRNEPLSRPAYSSGLPQSSSRPSPIIPQPSPFIRSQTPYNNRSMVNTSSSSSKSSRSSNSFVSPISNNRNAPSNLIYSTPSVTDAPAGSNLSGPSAPYQSFRP